MAMLALMIVSAFNVVVGGTALILIGAGVLTAVGLIDTGAFLVAWTVILLLIAAWFIEAA
jgi:predicted anti-sigma-YlaC factor YlaD